MEVNERREKKWRETWEEGGGKEHEKGDNNGWKVGIGNKKSGKEGERGMGREEMIYTEMKKRMKRREKEKRDRNERSKKKTDEWKDETKKGKYRAKKRLQRRGRLKKKADKENKITNSPPKRKKKGNSYSIMNRGERGKAKYEELERKLKAQINGTELRGENEEGWGRSDEGLVTQNLGEKTINTGK